MPVKFTKVSLTLDDVTPVWTCCIKSVNIFISKEKIPTRTVLKNMAAVRIPTSEYKANLFF